MLCDTYHPSFFSHMSVSIWKYNGVTVAVNMHPKLSHTQTCIQVELSHTRALQNTVPNRRGSFLNITIISLYCNARTDWLSPGATNTVPRVIQEVGSRRGDAIFTHAHTDSRTQSRNNTFYTLLCQPLNFPKSKAFLFDMAYNYSREAEPISTCVWNGLEQSPGFNCCLRTER